MNPPDTLAPWLAPLGWLALEAMAVVLAVLAVQPFLRTAAARRSLWRAALLALVAVLAAELTGTGSQLPAQFRLAWQTTFPKPAPPIPPPIAIPLIEPPDSTPITYHPFPIPAAEAPAPLPFSPEPLPEPPPAPSLHHSITPSLPPPPPPVWPAGIWLAGLAALLMRAAWTHAGFAWLRLRHFIPAAEALRQRAQSLAARLGLRRRVRVLASERLRAPAAFGWVRPGVGVPGDFTARFAPAQQDVMLAHELAHLAARDPLWQLLADLAAAALWWHPLAWVARRQHRLAGELAADDASQALPDGPVVLAECLLALGHEAAAAPRAALGMAGFRSQLGRRVERLVALPHRDWQAPSRLRLALQTTVALLALAALALLPGCAANRSAGEAPSSLVAKWWQAKQAPVGDDARSLSKNAERGVRNAESSKDFGSTILRLFNERRQPAWSPNSPARLAELEDKIAATIAAEVARLRAEFTTVCAKLPTDLELLRKHLEKINQSLKQLIRAANTNALKSDQRHMDVMQRYREEVENILKVEELDRAIPRSATQGRVLFNGTPPAERDIPLPILGAVTTRLQEVEQARKQKIAAFEQAGAEYKRLVESASDPNVSVQERDQRKQAAEAKLRDLQKVESNIAESDRATRFLLGEQVRIRAKAVLTTRFHRVSPDGGLADVLVYVKEGLPSVSFPASTNPHVIRIQGYEYQPYITAVQTGQPIRWETDVDLNFHPTPTNPANREFNRVLVPGRPVEATFTAPEFFLRTKDDVHPWLFGYVSVLPHPFFAVTDAEGRFRFPRPLPPGKYTLAAVHRQVGESVQELDLTQPLPAGQPPEIEFILSTKPVASYVVVVGDEVRMEVYQRGDLRTQAKVQPDGTLTLPLIGAVKAAGKTISELRNTIRDAYEATHFQPAHITIATVQLSQPLAPPPLLSTPKQAADFTPSKPPTREELFERKQRLEAEIKEAEKTYRPTHPKMVGLRKQLETVEEAFRQQALVAREFEFVSRRLKQVEYVERKLQNPVYTASERLQFYASVDYEALREAPLVDPLPPGQRPTNGTVLVPRVPGAAAADWIEVERQKLNLEQSIKELSRVYRPSHPKMQALTKQLEAINRLLEEEERKAAAKLKFLKDALQKQQRELLEKKAPVAADVRRLTSPQTPDAKPQAPTVSQSLLTSAATNAPAAKNWTPAQRAILQRLDSVVFPEVTYDGLPLPEVVKMLQQDARKYDPEKKGFNFLLNSAAQPLEAPARIDLNTVLIKVTSVFRGLTLAQVLDLVCKTASEPIQFVVEDYGIVFTPRDRGQPFVAPRLVERPAGGLTPAQRALLQRLDTVVFPEFTYDGLPLPEVVKWLEADGRKHDPEKKGFNFLLNSTGQHGDAATQVDLDVVLIHITSVLRGLTLNQVLDVICKTADVRRPDGRNGGLQFTVEDYGIIFTPRDLAKPFVAPRLAEQPVGAAVRAKLDKIVIPQVAFDGIPLPEVIKMFTQDARQHDPDKQGVNLLATRFFPDPPPGWRGLPVGPDGKLLPRLLDAKGSPIPDPQPAHVELPDLDTVIINVPQVLNGLTLFQALDVVCNTASRPITYRVEDYGVLITPKYPVPPAPKPAAPRGALPELEKSRAVVLQEIDGVQAKFAIAQRELAAAQRSGPPPEVERCAKVVAELDTRFKAATAELARLEAQLQPKPQASDTVNPGDSLKLLVAEDDSYDAIYPVKRDGSITVKGVGRVSVGGRRLNDAQAAVKALLEETQLPKATVTLEFVGERSGTNTVSTAANGQRVIHLAGEFITPGPLKLAEGESLTLTNALLRSGGITSNGDLARVKLLRIENGQGAVEEVNVAAILAGTRPATNHALLPGDIIMVPVRPPVVHVTGSVVKPGPVSLPKDEPLTVNAAILRVGGLAPGASLTNCYIVRDAGNGGKVQIPLSVMGANLALQARDIVVVPGPKAEGKNGVLHEPELKAALQKALGERVGSELANAPLLQPMNPPKPRAAAEALPTNSTTLLHPTNPPKPVQSSTGALPATRAAVRQQIAAGNLGEPVKVTLPGSIGEAARTATVQATEVRTVTAPLTPVAADVRRLTSPQTPPASQSLLTSAATNATPASDPLQAAQEEALRWQERMLVLDRLLGEARQFQKIKSWTNAVGRYEEGLLFAPPLNGPFGAPPQVTDAIAGLNYCRLQLAIEHKQRSEFAQATELADKVLALDPANDFARLVKQLVERVSKPTPSAAAVSVDAADQAKAERLIASARLRLGQNNTRDALQNLWAALLTNPRSDADSSLLLLLLDKRFEDERVRLAATQWGRVVAVTQKWNEEARSKNGLPVPNPYAKTNSQVPFLTHSSKGAQRINRKLEEIVLPEVHFDAVPLVEVVKWLDVAARNHDPEKKGLNFLFNDVAPQAPLLDAGGNPVPGVQRVSLGEGLIRVSQPLKNLTLRQALDVICKNAELPTQFSVEEYAIVFIPRGPVAYYSRIFRVNPDTFIQGLQGVVGSPVLGVTSGGANQPGAAGQNQPATTTTTTGPVRAVVPATVPATQRTAAEANALVRQFFQSAGVTALGATNGSTRVFFNPENGLLVARGTTNDLRVIEQAIQKVQPSATPPPTGPESRAPERDRPGRSSPASTNAPTSSTPSAPAKPVVKIETRIFERAEPLKNLTGLSLANTLRLDMPGLFTNQVMRATDVRSQFWPPLTTNQLPTDGRMECEFYEARTQLAVVMSGARREALLKSLAGSREWRAPDVRLRDGQQGQAQSVEVSTVMVGTPPSANPRENAVNVTTGVTVDLWPKLSADSTSMQLGYLTDVREFLGYAHTTKNPPEAVPRFRVRQAIGTNTLALGESLLLTVVATVPPPGNGPGAAPGGAERTLFVLLTATLDDNAQAAPERDRPGRSSPVGTNAPTSLPPGVKAYYRTNGEAPFLTHSSKGAQRISRKLDEIILPEIHFDNVSLPAVVTWLDGNVKKFDPEKKGLNFLINNVVSDYISPKAAAPLLDPKGNPIVSPAAKPPRPDLETALIKVTRPIKDLTLRQVLDVICKTATVKMPDGRTAGLKYSVEEYAIVFSPKLPEQPDRFSRIFKVDPELFVRGLASVTPDLKLEKLGGRAEVERLLREKTWASPAVQTNGGDFRVAGLPVTQKGVIGVANTNLTVQLNQLIRDFFIAAGVAKLAETNAGPDATQVFFNDRNGLLLVRASLQDLDIIQMAIELLNVKPPQVLIEAKFVEISQNDDKAVGFDWFKGNAAVKPPEAQPDGVRRLWIDREGNYKLDGRARSLDQIEDELKAVSRTNAGVVVRIGAEHEARYSDATPVFERLSRIGITNSSFAVAPEMKGLPVRQPTAVNPTGIFPQPAQPGGTPAATGIVTNKLARTNAVGLATLTGILTAPQFAVVMRALEQRDATSVRSFPKVTTPSGKPVVLEPAADAKAGGGLAQGLKLEVLPSVDANGHTINFTVIVTRDGKQILESRGVVWDAQTVMLGFPGAMRVPVLGDPPLVGRLFQPPAATNTPGRFLLFLTPTLVDPAGNRIHRTDEEMPFAPVVTPQPVPAKK